MRMVSEIHDVDVLQKAVSKLDPRLAEDFDSAIWLEQETTKAIRIGNDIALLEETGKDVFMLHWLFESRGKQALKNAECLVEAMFKEGAECLYGLTPMFCVAARAFNRILIRRIGGKYCGQIVTAEGIQELFRVTKSEFRS